MVFSEQSIFRIFFLPSLIGRGWGEGDDSDQSEPSTSPFLQSQGGE
jgi:hypothetical protein